MTEPRTVALTPEQATLVDRLRGHYRIPIRDGLGATGGGEEPDNPNEFVRTFQTTPIMHEAAAEIERLRAALATPAPATSAATEKDRARRMEAALWSVIREWQYNNTISTETERATLLALASDEERPGLCVAYPSEPTPAAWANGARLARKGDVSGMVQIVFQPSAYYDTPLYAAAPLASVRETIEACAEECDSIAASVQSCLDIGGYGECGNPVEAVAKAQIVAYRYAAKRIHALAQPQEALS